MWLQKSNGLPEVSNDAAKEECVFTLQPCSGLFQTPKTDLHFWLSGTTSLSVAQKQFHYWGVDIKDIREEGFPSTTSVH